MSGPNYKGCTMKLNPILDTDSYKSSQWLQYPPNTTEMFSYLESRGGKYDRTVFFGLQYIIKEQLCTPITMEMVHEAKEIFEAHGEPFNYEGWSYIARDLNGKIPVRIKAVPEGCVVPTSNLLISVESLDPKCFWVVGWLETKLLRVWYPITVATQSYTIKQVIRECLNKTSDDAEAEIGFKLHDFGSRGVSSLESAAIGGCAHLVNFMGTDTVAGLVMARRYYNTPMAGFSIPASEHSTITAWGRKFESSAYRNLIEQFAKPGAMFACVSDSYDIYHAVENIWGKELRDAVVNSGATLVIRPDSGDPTTVVLKTIQLLDQQFGSSYNNKGFKVLSHVQVLQGDGINEETIRNILQAITSAGYSATNIAFGMGGALLQQVNRDTQKFAFKCSHVVVDGVATEVFKDPITDPGKRSKKGKIDLIKTDAGYETVQGTNTSDSVMEIVYENGELIKEYTLEEIRANAARG